MILITGAAGYIGSVLRASLPPHTYIGVDSYIKPGDHSPDVMVADVNDVATICFLLSSYPVTAVVNLAAIVGDPACKKYPSQADSSNVAGVKALLTAIQWARKKTARSIRLVQASTCSVYGFNTEKVSEESPVNPLSLYASQKVIAEKMISESNEYWVILRFATAFGWSPSPRFDLTVNEFTREYFFSRALEVFREDDLRPYCHVKDLARMIIAACSYLEPFQIYNVGGDYNTISKKQLVGMLDREFSPQTNTARFVPGPGDDPRNYDPDFSKLNSALPNKPWGTAWMTVLGGIREIIEGLRSMEEEDAYSTKYRSDYLNV